MLLAARFCRSIQAGGGLDIAIGSTRLNSHEVLFMLRLLGVREPAKVGRGRVRFSRHKRDAHPSGLDEPGGYNGQGLRRRCTSQLLGSWGVCIHERYGTCMESFPRKHA